MKKEMPPELAERVVHLEYDNSTVVSAAQIEAMMTFMKYSTGEDAGRIVMMPGVAESRQDIFNYGRVYAMTMLGLESGEMSVLPQIAELFDPEREDGKDVGLSE